MRLGVEAALVDGRLLPGDVEIVGDTVADVGLPSANGRGIAAPGFVDLQVNGFGGVDFLEADAEGYRRAGEAMLETGRHRLPADLHHRAGGAADRRAAPDPAEARCGPEDPRRALEGPFLASGRLGTHRAISAARSRRRRCSTGCSPPGRSG